MKFRDLKIGTKLTLGFALIVIIMGGANFYSINKLANLKSEIDEVSNNWLPRAIAISDINLNTSDLRRAQLQYALASDETVRKDQAETWISAIRNINENLKIYEQLKTQSEKRNLYSDSERKLYSEFEEKWETYQDLSFTFFKLSANNENEQAISLLNSEAREMFNDFSAALVQLVKVNKKDALEAARRADHTYYSTRNIFRVLLTITILASVFIAILLARLISIPLKHLVDAVGQVADGNLEVQLNIAGKDEVGILSHSFDQMTVSLREARDREQKEAKLRAEAAELRVKAREAETKVLKSENERKTHELAEARKLQLSMLPKKLPQVPNLEIAAYMKTATEVGGDYYDFKVDDDTLTVAIGDASGHGTKAGIVVTAVKSLFEVLAVRSDIANILREISSALKGIIFHNMFMAMTLLKIKGDTMRLAAAGMPFPIIWRAATHVAEEVEIKGLPLGVFLDTSYKEQEIKLHPGDTIVLMSDGLPERLNPDGEMLDYENMTKIVAECGDKSPDAIIEHLIESGDKWARGHPQDDDVTFVVMKVK